MHGHKKKIKGILVNTLRILKNRAWISIQENKNRLMHLTNLFLISNMTADHQTLIYLHEEIENINILLDSQEAR